MNLELEKKTDDNKTINFENVEINVKNHKIVTSERNITKPQEIVKV